MSLFRRDSMLRANLFPERAWLAGSTVSCGAHQHPAAQLEALLEASGDTHTGKRLTICLSDTYVATLPLPWLDGLHKREEQLAYARTVFERGGIQVEERNVLHVMFRSIGALGFAYAVADALLDELRSVAAQGDIELVNVMPVSALAYWHCRVKQTRQLLVEEGRVTLLTRQAAVVSGLDVEPTVGGSQPTLARMFARANLAEDASVHVWSSRLEAGRILEEVQAILGEHRVFATCSDEWSLRQ